MRNLIPREQRLVKSLSWSKIEAKNKSKKGFIDTYFTGKEFFETKEILFGKMFGKILETQSFFAPDSQLVDDCLTGFDGILKDDQRKREMLEKSMNHIIGNTPVIEKLEAMSFDFGSQFEVKLMDFIDDVCVIGFADNTTDDMKYLKEFKTGKTPWTQERVDNHGQLDLYCLMIYRQKGYFPKSIELIWAETGEDEEKNVILTGKIETFVYDVEKHKERILSWEKEIPKIFEEIMEWQLEWEQKKGEETLDGFDESLVMELADVTSQMKALEERQSFLKKSIEENLKQNNLDEYKKEGVVTIYKQKRKSWDYGDTLKKIEEEKAQTLEKIKEENKPIFERIEEVTKSFDTIYNEKKKEFEEENAPIVKETICFKF